MSYFCENCGTKLASDATFCENCGARVATVDLTTNLTIFTKKDWANAWKTLTSSRSCEEYGIILINTDKVPSEHYQVFIKSLAEYIAYRFENGVSYCVLDLADQSVRRPLLIQKIESVDFVVKTLRDICGVYVPDYLLIVGDRDCVNSAKWENGNYSPFGNGDSDKYVDSDVPYSTLSETSLFKGGSFKFLMKVGRIPTSAKNGFSEAIKYFKNTKTNNSKNRGVSTVVLGAIEWKEVTQRNFEKTKAAFYTCPFNSFEESSNLNIIPYKSSYDLFCFNLHGMGATDYWVSGSRHIAFSPYALPQTGSKGYVIATEACYGAKPIIRDTDQSVLITALANDCRGFLGSTQIAYGSPCEEYPSLGADILVGKFAEYVSSEWNTGSAYMKALTYMMSDEGGGCVTLEDVKTFSSFALYGDPSIALTPTTRGKTVSKEEKNVTVIMPDVSRLVQLKLNVVSKKITERFWNIVYNQYPEFKDQKISVYKYELSGGCRIECSNTVNGIDKILVVYTNKNDDVDKVYISK